MDNLSPTMILLVLGAILIAVFVVLWLVRWLLESRFKSSSKAIKYTLNPSLFTEAERSFIGCLDSVLPPEIRVFAKVRLADLFAVEKNKNRADWRAAFNRIQSKHVDFLLCKSDDLSPLAAIELDDKTHATSDRQERDKFLNDLFADSSIKLLRVSVQNSYDTEELAQLLNEAFQAE